MFKRVIIVIMLLAFALTGGVVPVSAQMLMPPPGAMVQLSPSFSPALLTGIKVHPEDPYLLDFILDPGKTKSSGQERHTVEAEAQKLIRYFLAAVTVPERDLWVNLSPYEHDRITPKAFGQTEMGRDLLSQDYLLKQITASLMFPQGETGKVFWTRIYQAVQAKNGTIEIPVDTFNKVWILPEKAEVFEKDNAVYVTRAHLKVMLDTDYLAEEKSKREKVAGDPLPPKGYVPLDNVVAAGNVFSRPVPSELSKQVLRETILPILEKEINEGQNFAPLRQVYNSLILATWYKDKIKDSLLKTYVDQNKVAGVDIADKDAKDKIWAQYVAAFKKGVYNYIKEEYDPGTEQIVPRKYFSGGITVLGLQHKLVKWHDHAMLDGLNSPEDMVVQVELYPANNIQDAYDNAGQQLASYEDFKEWFQGALANKELSQEELASAFKRLYGKASVPEGYWKLYWRMLSILKTDPKTAYIVASWKQDELNTLLRIVDALTYGLRLDIGAIEAVSVRYIIENELVTGVLKASDDPQTALAILKAKLASIINDSSLKFAIRVPGKASINAVNGFMTASGLDEQRIILLYSNKLDEIQAKNFLSAFRDVRSIKDFDWREKIDVRFADIPNSTMVLSDDSYVVSLPLVPFKFLDNLINNKEEYEAFSSPETAVVLANAQATVAGFSKEAVVQAEEFMARIIGANSKLSAQFLDKLWADPAQRIERAENVNQLFDKESFESIFEANFRRNKPNNSFARAIFLEARLNAQEPWPVRQVVVQELGPLYVKMLEAGQRISFDILLTDLDKDDSLQVRQAILSALTQVYAKKIEQGQQVALSVFEDRLNNEKNWGVRQSIVDLLGSLYFKLLEIGQRPAVDVLESYLNKEPVWFVRRAIVEKLGLLYAKMLDQSLSISSSVLTDQLHRDSEPQVREAIVNILVSFYAKTSKDDQQSLVATFEYRLKSEEDPNVRPLLVNSLGVFYKSMLAHGQVPLDSFASHLNNELGPEVRAAIMKKLVRLYAKMFEDEGDAPVAVLETFLNIKVSLTERKKIGETLSLVYIKRLEQGQMTLEAVETLLNNEEDSDVWKLIASPLGKIYIKQAKSGQMSLGDLEKRLNSAVWPIRQAVVNALGVLYVEKVEAGEPVLLLDLEERLKWDDVWQVREEIVNALGSISMKKLDFGQDVSIDPLIARFQKERSLQVVKAIMNARNLFEIRRIELGQVELGVVGSRLSSGGEEDAWQSIVKTLAPVLIKKVEGGQMTSNDLVDLLESGERPEVRHAAAKALEVLDTKLIEQGKVVSLGVLEDHFKTPDGAWQVREAVVAMLGRFYIKEVLAGQMNIADLEGRLNAKNAWPVRKAAVNSLGYLYVKKLEDGQRVSTAVLEDRLNNDDEWPVRKELAIALGLIYSKMLEMGQPISVKALDMRLGREEDHDVQEAIGNVLGPLYLKMVEIGLMTVDDLWVHLNGNDSLVQQIYKDIGSLYIKMVETGRMTLEDLEARLDRERWSVDQVVLEKIGSLYIKMVESGQMTLGDVESRLFKGILPLRQLIGRTLGPLYVKTVESGQMTLGELEERLNNADWRVKQVILGTLGQLYVKRFESGPVSGDDQMRYAFWNRNQLSLLGGDTYVRDHVFGLDMLGIEQAEALLADIMKEFEDANTKLSQDRRSDQESFQRDQLPFVYALELFLPGRGAHQIISFLKQNNGAALVVRFLNGKRSLLKNGQVMEALNNVLERIRQYHRPGPRKKYKIDTTAVFKIMNTLAAFIDLGKSERSIQILENVSGETSILELAKYLEEAFSKELISYFNISQTAVTKDVQQLDLYMPYLSRIREAMAYIEQNEPEKYGRFKALLTAMLEGRFLDFIENTEQEDPEGVLIAKHNLLVRKALKGVGLNVERWLGWSREERMPEGSFMYYENAHEGYDLVFDVTTVIEYLKRILNSRIHSELHNTLTQYLVSIDLLLEVNTSGEVAGFKPAGVGKKKDIIDLISHPNAIKGLLEVLGKIVATKSVSEDVALRVIATDLIERVAALKSRLENPIYKNVLGKKREHFRIHPIRRDPGHDLFIGDLTNCCLGMNSNLHPEAMMERLIDEGLNVLEVIDERTQKTMAAAWLYIATDGSLVIQNLEIHPDYEDATSVMKNAIGSAMINYAREFAKHIGSARLLIGEPSEGKYFDEDGLVPTRYKNMKVPYGLDKIGGYLGEKYFLDSTGKASAYLVSSDSIVDASQVVLFRDDVGGIDLTSPQTDLTATSSGQAIEFTFDPDKLKRFQNAPGLSPVIINIQPLLDLKQFLKI